MSSRPWRAPAQAVQDAFQRRYERYGPLGLVVVGAATLGPVCLVVTFASTIIVAPYAGIRAEDMAPFSTIATSLVVVAFALCALVTRGLLRLAMSWRGDGRTADLAVEVWNAGLALPRVLALRTGLIFYALVLVNQAVYYAVLDLPWAVFGPHAVGDALVTAAACLAGMLYLEFLLRPAMADVGQFLPDDFEPAPQPLSLRAKAILPIPGIVVFTGLFVGALVDTTGSFWSQMVGGLIITVTISVVAVALWYVLVHAVLDPIDQLTEATRRVRGGDLDTRVPVVSADELGVLAIRFNQMVEGLQEREQLREHNTELAGALEHSLSEVQASRARIVAAADDERRRMERDLHDGAQQRLVMISLKLAMAREQVAKDPDAAVAMLDELRSDASRAVDELRDLAHGIYPPLLESDGLGPALEDVADSAPLPIAIEDAGTGRYPSPVEAAVYFCCLEALQNAAKHAGPGTHATIHLAERDGELRFLVSDDGQGFDAASLNGSAGLQNMADRIGALGGTVSVRSTPGAGTTVEGSVPV